MLSLCRNGCFEMILQRILKLFEDILFYGARDEDDMAKRVKLMPEVTEPRFRMFLDTVPMVRRMNKDVLREYPVKGERLEIPLEGREITVYLHRAASANRPVIFEFHSGGFVFGSADADDPMCETICRDGDFNVVGVDYRLAPENRYPAAADDAYDIIKYFHEHAEEYDIDGEKLGVIGCSAGANLAAVCALRAAERKEFTLGAQVLHYPYLDARRALNPDPESEHYDADLDSDLSYGFTKSYSEESQIEERDVSPIFATDDELKGVAPACVLVAELDGLKFEGKEYADRMKKQGVKVLFEEIPGAHHCYIEDAQNMDKYEKYTDPASKEKHSRDFPERAREALSKGIEFFKDVLG